MTGLRSQPPELTGIIRGLEYPTGAGQPTARRLLAILAADVAGYSRLMGMDEEDTHARMRKIRHTIVEPSLASYRGVVIKNTGDGFLATFENVHDAVHCVVGMQQALVCHNNDEPLSRRINFRMGVHVADVILDDGDIFGEGVNIAARLQTYAEPGGVVVSGILAEHLGRHEGVKLFDLGDLHLHNISHPIRAFSLTVADPSSGSLGEAQADEEGRASIVVLPFREHYGRPGDEYFAEGIVDDVVHALSGLKELFVISRGSTLGYNDPRVDVRSIGRELGVRYVMHGSLQRTESRIRIRAELCNSVTGAIIWTDQTDAELGDLFDLQRRITMRVISTLAPRVRERERLRAMRKHPQNMTAYDLVLQALGPLFHMDYASFSQAHGLLQRAIVHDPQYGPAYSYTSYWHLLRVGQGWSNDVESDALEAARTAAKAIDLDENDALALAIYGHVHSYLKKDYDTAVELQDRAVDVGPSCAMVWTLSSVTRGYLGQGQAAVIRAERGLQLSPRGPHVVYHEHILSQAHYINGNYDDAVLWGRRAARHAERLTSNLRCLVASLVAIGQVDDARHVATRLLEFDPGMSLRTFASRTPLQGSIRDLFVERLRAAGIPD